MTVALPCSYPLDIRIYIFVVKMLVKAGADLQTAISSANIRLELLRVLLKAGAELEAKVPSGYTPLHLAAGKGHVEVVTALLKAGAESNDLCRRHTSTRLCRKRAPGGCDSAGEEGRHQSTEL